MADFSTYEHLRIEVEDGVAVVTIPVVGSSGRVQAGVHREVSRIWSALGDDDDTEVVVVTGSGPDFYRSADLEGLRAIPRMSKDDTFTLLQRMFREGRDIVYQLVNLDKPVVAAVNGAAAGGGLAVALLADISIAAEDAELVDPHVAMGLAAGDHAAMVWPLLCGMAKSKLYLLTSDPVSGREAERIGLVSLAVPGEQVMETAMAYAGRLARLPRHAVRLTKRALNQWLRLGGLAAHDYAEALEGLTFFGGELGEAVEAAGAGHPAP